MKGKADLGLRVSRELIFPQVKNYFRYLCEARIVGFPVRTAKFANGVFEFIKILYEINSCDLTRPLTLKYGCYVKLTFGKSQRDLFFQFSIN